jgi:ATP-dependent protease ClpP protease subunit
MTNTIAAPTTGVSAQFYANGLTLRLYGDVGIDVTAVDVASELQGANGRDVSVHVFSSGGSASEGLAIYNILSSYSGSVTTIIDGIAASAAGIIFMAGSKRIMPENTLFHMHSTWGYASGNAEKMRSLAEQFDAHTQAFIEIYIKKSGQDREKVNEWLIAGSGNGTWFSAADALAMGFATEVAPAEEVRARLPAPPAGRLDNAPPTLATWFTTSANIPTEFDSSAQMPVSASAAEAAPPAPVPPAPVPPAPVAPAMAAVSAHAAATASESSAAELAALRRENEIRRCAAQASLPPDQVDALIAGGKPFADVALEIVRAHAATVENRSQAGHPARIGVTRDHGDTIVEGLTDAVLAKIKPNDAPSDKAIPYRGMRMMEFVRTYANSRGINTVGRTPHELISLALHVSDDFSNILSNAANKSMMTGWAEETHQWDQFSRRRDLPDFRPTNDMFVSGSLDPIKVNQGDQSDKTKIDARMEGSEYQMATLQDGRTSWRLDKFTRGLRVAEEVFINDDLSALQAVPEMFGRGARRVQANAIYALITGNATVSMDGLPLFHASHNNTGAGLINVDGMATGMLKLSTQKDPAGNPLELEPDFFLGPRALQATAMQFLYPNNYAPSVLSGNAGPNPYAGAVRDLYSARLDTTSTTQWYLIAGPGKVEGIVYGYLEGESGPTLTTDTKRNPDCVEFLFRMYFGCAIKDWRFIYRASGVAP